MRTAMTRLSLTIAALLAACTAAAPISPIRLSENRRNFVTADGRSFFYLADTAWTITTRLTLDEVDEYLADRSAKGFNVVQLVVVPWGARSSGNRAGAMPFIDDDMGRPNPEYFDHVEAVLDRIEAKRMYPAVVPFWLAGLPEPAPNEARAYHAYATYLGQRFGKRQMFWLLGADRAADPYREIIRDFATELSRSSGRKDSLMTHHPQGGQSSSRWFHNDEWLDFNMIQSGHNLDLPHYRLIDQDYARQPVKPVLDGESAYENLVNNLQQYEPGARLVTAYDVRRQTYQNVFAGAAGIAYGCCEIYEFFRDGDSKARWTVGTPWRDALKLPGSTQVGHLAKLIESRSPLDRMPDQSLIASPNPDEPARHMKALRDKHGQWAYVYSPTGDAFKLDPVPLKQNRLKAHWFNPRDGQSGEAFPIAATAVSELRPPTAGPDQDWVLIVDAGR